MNTMNAKDTVVESTMKKYKIERSQANKRVEAMTSKMMSSRNITKKMIDKILSTPIN